MEVTKFFVVMFDPEARQFHDKQEAIDWAKTQMNNGNGYQEFYVFESVHGEVAEQVYKELKFVERDPTIGELRQANVDIQRDRRDDAMAEREAREAREDRNRRATPAAGPRAREGLRATEDFRAQTPTTAPTALQDWDLNAVIPPPRR
jgi:hypothetical protein